METTRFAKSLGRATGLRSLLLWLGLAVTVLFTYLAVRNVDFGEVSSALPDLPAKAADLRAADRLLRAHVRRGEEDHLA